MTRVEISGTAEAQRRLKQLGDDVLTKQVYKAAADVVLARAVDLVPQRTGRTRRTGRTSGTKTAGVMRFGTAQTPWVGPLVFGDPSREQGGYMVAQPFPFDAAEQRQRQVRDVMNDSVGRRLPRFL